MFFVASEKFIHAAVDIHMKKKNLFLSYAVNLLTHDASASSLFTISFLQLIILTLLVWLSINAISAIN